MSIPQKMKSTTEIIVDGVDLYSVTELTARVKQGDILLEKPLTVVDSHKAYLSITRDEAETFNEKKALEVQILWVNENGMPECTGIKTTNVARVIGGVFGG